VDRLGSLIRLVCRCHCRLRQGGGAGYQLQLRHADPDLGRSPSRHWRVAADLIDRRTWIFLLLSGLATGASWLCYFRALKLGPVSQVAPIDKLSLLLVAVLGVLFLGEKLSVRNWMGVLLMAVGAFLVAFRK
jgi:drug/metabolite transporter (DMT)-like permease